MSITVTVMSLARVVFVLVLLCGIFASAAAEPFAAIPSEHIEKLYSLGPRVLSGGSPESPEAFEELRKLGVTTIISVDGSKPRVDAARAAGLKYIHLPIGYDGASRSNIVNLIKAAQVSQTNEGKIFVHCHHGQHRGPAAAAIICQAEGSLDTSRALAWLKEAGTSPDYPGLFQMVDRFQRPAAEELAVAPNSFPETAAVTGLIQGMVEIDRRWDHLKAVRSAGYSAPANHPDLVPAKEAVLMAEAYRELARSEEAQQLGADFVRLLHSAGQQAAELGDLFKNTPLSTEARAAADRLMTDAARRCSSCHKQFRN